MRKLKRKPNKLEEIVQEPVKKKKLIKYKREKCSFVYADGHRCQHWCVGNGNVCNEHGGVRAAQESMITTTGMLPSSAMKYDPAKHPILFIELSRQGFSDVEVAAQFEVSVVQLRSWVEKYREFATAHEVGQAMYEAWWLQEGKDHLNSRYYQTGLFKFLTGNKLGWSDKIETKNLNSNQFGVLLIPGTMSVDEWEAANIREDEEREAESKATIDIEGEVSNV
jgi:hypothetical protein